LEPQERNEHVYKGQFDTGYVLMKNRGLIPILNQGWNDLPRYNVRGNQDGKEKAIPVKRGQA
jgi:hypothetical protein